MIDITQEVLSGSGETFTCPWCGLEDQVSGTTCKGCRRNILGRSWLDKYGQKKRSRVGRRLVLTGIFVILLGLIISIYYPVIPDPTILLFHRPTTELTSTSLPGQWSMDGGDSGRTRYVDSFALQPRGRVLWSQGLGESTLSGPVVVDGAVYVGGYFKILSLDAETGDTLWEIETTGPVNSSPAVAGDNLYVGLLDGRLMALDRETGDIRWKFKSQSQFTSSASVAKGIIYSGSWDHSIYALDAATGRVIWRYETDGAVSSQPTIHEGVLVAADRKGKLYILNARTGQERLVFRTAKSATASPVIGHGMVYFPAMGSLYAVDASAREIPGQYHFKKIWAQFYLWQVPGVPIPPGQQGGLWRFSPEGPSSSIVASPALAEEAYYVGDLQGNFYAQDAISAKDIWRFRAAGAIATSPIIVADRVFFGTQDGFLYALNRFNGEMIWRLSLGAPIEISPAFSEGRLYVRTSDGRLHAVE